jgi:multiple sugar transport system permease protein
VRSEDGSFNVKVSRIAIEGRQRPFGLRSAQTYPVVLGYALLAPLALLIVLVLVYPLLQALYLSLTNTRIIGGASELTGVGNYGTVLTSSGFWRGLLLSLAWLAGHAVVLTVLSFGVALLLRRPSRFARIARVWVLLPWVIPTVAVAVIWQWMLNSNYGIISFVLQATGITSSPLNVFGSSKGALIGLILTNSWHWFALPAVVIFGAMQTIPEELYDAAKVDGAGAMAQFRHITLPMIARTLFVLELVGNLWMFNSFDVIFLITRGGPADATMTLPVELYYTAFKAWRIGEAAAMAVIMLVFLSLASFAYVKLFAPSED